MRDIFEWWAYIWIPSLLGVATLGVAVVAVVVSRNASRLAHQIEASRVEDDRRRDVAEARHRLFNMAADDARALRRWFVEARRAPNFFRTRGINDPPPPQLPHEMAKTNAVVQLEQSLVPGALDLLRLTEFDLKNRLEFLPDYVQDEPAESELVRRQIVEARDNRSLNRIRDWGLDPETNLDAVARDLASMSDDSENYLKISPYVHS